MSPRCNRSVRDDERHSRRNTGKASAAGTPVDARRVGLGLDDIDAELGEIVAGKAPGRTSAGQLTVFGGVGLALHDLVAAAPSVTHGAQVGIGPTDIPSHMKKPSQPCCSVSSASSRISATAPAVAMNPCFNRNSCGERQTLNETFAAPSGVCQAWHNANPIGSTP